MSIVFFLSIQTVRRLHAAEASESIFKPFLDDNDVYLSSRKSIDFFVCLPMRPATCLVIFDC